MPSTAPTWRKAALTALAVAKRSSATSRTAAEPRVGKARPIPIPVRTAPGSQRPSQSGSAPAERRTMHPGREDERAGDDHGAVAEAVGEPAGRAGDDRRHRRPGQRRERRR